MAWDDEAPTKAEINLLVPKQPRWDEEPPPAEALDQPGTLASAISDLATSNKRGLEQYGGGKGLGRTLLKGGLEALPGMGSIAGGLIGGTVGAPLGPGGAFVTGVEGAGIGAALGAGAKTLGEKYLLDEQMPADVGEEIAKQGAVGLLSELGGQTIAKPLGFIGGKIGQYVSDIKGKVKPNAAEIEAAAERLGFKAPQSLTTDSETIQKLEQSLAQSPRFTATPERKMYENMRKGLIGGGEKLEGLKSIQTDAQLGNKLKEGLINEIKAARQPVSDLYENVNQDLYRIKLQQPIINKNMGVLKRDSAFAGQSGTKFLEEIKSEISDLKTVGDLKEYRTNLLKRGAADEYDRLRFNKVYDQITNLRDESIQALKETDPFVKASGKSGKEVIDELHDRLVLADKEHANNIAQLEKIKAISGKSSPVKSQQQFIRDIEKIPSEELIQKAANVDVATLNEIKTKFPELFKNAQQAKLNDIVQASMDKGGLNTVRFIKNIDKLEPEVADAIFSKEQKALINDLRLINKEMPAKLGPSGTPEGLDFKRMLTGYPEDFVQSLLLNKPGLLKQTGSALQSPWLYRIPKGLIQVGGQIGVENK